jgi:hypothetical protein
VGLLKNHVLPLGATLELRLGVINTAKFRLTVALGIGGEVFQHPHSHPFVLIFRPKMHKNRWLSRNHILLDDVFCAFNLVMHIGPRGKINIEMPDRQSPVHSNLACGLVNIGPALRAIAKKKLGQFPVHVSANTGLVSRSIVERKSMLLIKHTIGDSKKRERIFSCTHHELRTILSPSVAQKPL